MKTSNLLFIIMIFSGAVLSAEGNTRIMEGLTMNSTILGQEVRYSIVLPVGYDKGKKVYPVVYLLHGLGDDESSWLEYGRIAQIADAAAAKREIVPMIFVMPQGFRNYYVNDYAGTFLYEDMFVNEFVPFVDKTYRTIPDNVHRATLGCSMGGFGALVLPARHPDVFSISVPLSTSLRTDEQYMSEEASGWNDQWGRIFGGVGLTGRDRITDYYKQYSPFYFFREMDKEQVKHLRIYMDNGDDEFTLCRSNEELHILLRDLKISHEYRVRNGGHAFSYWREALPNALHFISDGFEGKPYRGDIVQKSKKSKSVKTTLIKNNRYSLVLPPAFDEASRRYPVVYLFGDFDTERMKSIAGMVHQGIRDRSIPPLLLVFLKENESALVDTIIPEMESNYMARNGYRFRALIGFEAGGIAALRNAMIPEMFTSCILFDSPLDTGLIRMAIENNKEAMQRTWLFISGTDTGMHYKSNGEAHIFLRDEEIYHEYRVIEGRQGDEIGINRLTDAFHFTSEKIHR